jgi:hypothetical protein
MDTQRICGTLLSRAVRSKYFFWSAKPNLTAGIPAFSTFALYSP